MMRYLAALALLAACATATPDAPKILGAKPSYIAEVTASYPNRQAITPRYWIPGLEDGWTPQGLAIVGNDALVSAYQDTDASKVKCRVFRMELATGATTGWFDMPAPCVHAGGITSIGGGYVVLADTRQDWRINLEKAFATHDGAAAAKGMIKLARGFGSAFTFFDGKDLWNGVWVAPKDAADSKIYRLDMSLFDREGVSVDKDVPREILPVPIRAQGGALDRGGNLWISASEGPRDSLLYRLDRRTGAVLATYEMPSRIENIAFDGDGRLWAISESGSRKYKKDGDPDFPFVFEIDIAKLK
jgi:hypothetical protein